MMKRTTLLFIGILLCSLVSAQIPQGVSQQAQVRDSFGEVVSYQPVGVKVSVFQGSADQSPEYTETHNPQTNQHGLITFVIGRGETTHGSFQDINWTEGAFFLKTEIDLDGGTNYSFSDISPLYAVPYALHAGTSGDAFKGDMQGERIINLGNPVQPRDAVNKEYIDQLKQRVQDLEDILGIDTPKGDNDLIE